MGQLAHGNPYPVENPSSKLNSVVFFYFFVFFHMYYFIALLFFIETSS